MSMIEHEIENLKEIREELVNNPELDCDINSLAKEWTKYIDSAIDTIKTQSEKIYAYAMERSSMYYNGGWIPCGDRLPEDFYFVLLQYNPSEDVNEILIGYHAPKGEYLPQKEIDTWFANGEYITNTDDVIAWRPLPELFEEGEK